jgi:hypothetical protein
VPGSLGEHSFWNERDPQRKADERRAFLTDVSLIGGLIIAAVDTEGKPSLGWRGRRAARKLSEAVGGVLPAGDSVTDSAIAEKVEHGLQVGAERGREWAHLARERGAEWADVARERGAEWADVARERAPEFAEAARERGAEWAEIARERAPEFAEAARERAGEFADTARTQVKQRRRRWS